jgi:predicted DNA-binding helix-hairpin-helix protein
MFADDANLSCTGQASADIEYKINKDLDNIRKWIISNKLILNIGKTEYMIIGSKPTLDTIPETPKIIYGDYHLKRIKKKSSWPYN